MSDIQPADYRAFLEAKIPMAQRAGLPCSLDDVPAQLVDGQPLRDHQRHIVRWAVEGGRRALFEAFGLGKSIQQLLICDIILDKVEADPAREPGAPNMGLIVAPLGVRREFIADARKLGLTLHFVKSDAEIDAVGDVAGLFLTNYESVRDGKIDVSRFTVASLDEASVLRSYGSKTFQEFMPLFDAVLYRFVATATPSPNRYKELIHYAGFLGVMDTGQALTRFFQRNSAKAGDLTLYPHKEAEFFAWLNSWAVFLQRPSDLGFDDAGYDLPPLTVRWHSVQADLAAAGTESNGQGRLIRDAAMGITQAAREKRATLQTRIGRVIELVRSESLRSGLVPEEQGEGEGAQSRPLPGQPGSSPGQGSALAGGEPGACEGASAGVSRSQQGGSSGAREKTLPGEQGSRSGAIPRSQTEEVCAHAGELCGDARGARRPVQDLRIDESRQDGRGELLGGSLPRDGEGPRAPLSPVQCSTGGISRQSRTAGDGTRVPPQFIVWCDLNDEQALLERELLAAGIRVTSLYGNQPIAEREHQLQQWLNGDTDVLITKLVMYGSGANLQQCHRMIYAGVGFKFNDFVQGLHRIQRFGQANTCIVDIIHAETETEVVRDLQAKWARHEELAERMSEIIRKHGLQHEIAIAELKRSIGVVRNEARGDGWWLAHNDCVEEAASLETGSVDLIVTSIPFSNHYEYTPSYNDFGHTDDDAHFFAQLDHLTPNLLRALAPGRLACVHVKDRILFGSVTGEGVPTVNPFHAKCISHYMRHGFQYLGMIHVNTDVVRENNQTYRLSYSEMLKDGTKMGVGSPEYVLLMRKPQTDRSRGYADVPVVKDAGDYSLARWQIDAHAFWRSSGDRPLTPGELAEVGQRFADMPVGLLVKAFTQQTRELIHNHEAHVAIGEAIEARAANDGRGHLPRTFMSLAPGAHDPNTWDDVVRMRTLNGEQVRKGAEKHVCPLQFDIVDRLIERFSMKGELVFDPFAGLGTVPMRAISMGRRGAGSELNPDYFRAAAGYLREAEREAAVPTLFDLLGAEKAA
ncbi:DNA methyltransferase [Sphingomonas sp. ABOLF]|uniref:DNA methyltransferase n=1 Tax=Sphingomonas sp. ABOLF TaxID=1985879 RepID=UPI001F49F67B|nr:DNA methyltransferase [Sphingomonas sp. ABOLF]